MTTTARTSTWPTTTAFRSVLAAVFGTLLGVFLSRVGFTDFGAFQRMLHLQEMRLLLVFGGAATLAACGFALLRRIVALPPRPLHKGSLVGGVIFGVGWALSGACPAVAFVQLGEGRLLALWTLAGIVVGTRLYPAVHARWFRFDRGTCNG